MKKLIFALIAAATAMGSAQAAGPGPYVGVGVASADHNYNLSGTTNGSTDGYKASGKIFGGYEFDQTFGVEAGYTDFRKSTYNYNTATGTGRAESDGHSFYVAGKATAPINDQFAVLRQGWRRQQQVVAEQRHHAGVQPQRNQDRAVCGRWRPVQPEPEGCADG